MSRYIDADALMQDVIAHSYPLTNAYSVGGVDDGMFVTGIQQVVDEQPTVDAVPVVRCRDCKRYGSPIPIEMEEKGYGYCSALWSNTRGNEYCAWGERKSE